MKLLRKTSNLFVLLAVGVALGLSLTAGFLVFRGQRTLQALSEPHAVRTLDIYSRWLPLDVAVPVTRRQVEGWLTALSYQRVPAVPAKAGEFQETGDLVVMVRPFIYPDKAFPLQRLRLKFSGDRLQSMEGSTGEGVTEWRLEPKLLAQWVSETNANRPKIRLEEMPPHVSQAIIAVEDKRFYRHGAFDVAGIARALWVDLRHGQWRQGASTLSQQLARSIFLDVNRSWRRKVLEAMLAFYLEARFSKPQLLEMYINQVYWGQSGSEGLLGIESASRSYFGKSARQLTVAESALLAGVLQSPNRLSPRNAAGPALERRNRVLQLMLQQGMISQEVYAGAVQNPLHLAPVERKRDDAAYFLAQLRDQLADRYSLPLLMSQGWKVFSTLDPALQPLAAQAVRSLRPSGSRRASKNPEHPEGALVAMVPQTGAVRVWVGGTEYATSPFDRVLLGRRQPGSAFKPFVMLSALESGSVTTATLLEDKPLVLKGEHGSWSPQNYDRKFRGQASMWDSLVHSLNIPTVRLAMQTGLPGIVETAARAGIQSPLRPVPSLALGTSEVSVLELTNAYGTLANEGTRVLPYMVETILDGDGRIVETHTLESLRVFGPEVVYLVTQMLQGVLREGTARSAVAGGFHWPVAGKTGTSENYQDAWFLGYSPDLVCGVWVGYDRPRSLGHSAAGIALPIWTRFMDKALSMEGGREFAIPPKIVWKPIDVDSGLLVRSGCAHRRNAAFLPGTEPTQACGLHSGGLFGLFQRWTGSTSN